jgi:hypothetical protein
MISKLPEHGGASEGKVSFLNQNKSVTMEGMKRPTLIFLFLAVIGAVPPFGCLAGSSDGIDSASQDALAKTMELLVQPQVREKVIQGDSNAQYIDKQVKSIGGSEANTQEIYELAADIFQSLITNSNGDPLAAMTELQKAKADPKAFASKLSPAQQAKLKKLAEKINSQQLKPQGSAPKNEIVPRR